MVNYDRIWELCKVTGKKRSHLSKAMGHSDRYLLDARKQNTNIKADELEILAAELNTTPEYLTGETDNPNIEKSPAPKKGTEDFTKVYELLTPEHQEKIQEEILALLKKQMQG